MGPLGSAGRRRPTWAPLTAAAQAVRTDEAGVGVTCAVQLVAPCFREPRPPQGHAGLPGPVPHARLGLQETHEFEHVPVEDVVVGEALPVEEVAEELAQVGVVGLVVEPQRTAEVEVCGELGWCGGQGDRGCCREACAPRAPQMALSYPAPAPTDAPDL